MRIFLSQSEPEDQSLKHFTNVATLSRDVMDSEATHIVCDGFLSSFAYNDLQGLLKLICQKMRIGCELIIIEPDFYLISKHVFREEIEIELINQIVFNSNSLRSILTMKTIEKLLDPTLEVISKHFDEHLCKSIVTIKRNQ
jgi:hypothetical protein